MTAYLSTRQAVATARQQSGLSVATCQKAIADLPKRLDGKRYKVSRKALMALIDELTAPVAVARIKPLSARHRTIARATHTSNAIINRLKAQAARETL